MAKNKKMPDIVAALDLGSNSFHMIVARFEKTGTISVIDRLREPVRLRAGLTSKGKLKASAIERALACLKRFAERINGLDLQTVRIVGTNTLRNTKNANDFIDAAEAILEHPIEIIGGREEARLIYLGVAHGLAVNEGKRLVVDIGGGSTELIIGDGLISTTRESLEAGCVSLSMRYFKKGKITSKKMDAAILNAELAIYPVAHEFSNSQWEEAIGSSGTIKAIHNIVQANGWSEVGINLESLYRLSSKLIELGSIDKLELDPLMDDRKPVLAGGLAVLIAVFETLNIKQMQVSEESLREGLLYDLVGRIQHTDVRERSVRSVMKRWSLDRDQAKRVAMTAVELFDQVKLNWDIAENNHRDMLLWAAKLHEIGLQISHSGYHKHGAYVLSHADLSGFSRQEQALLAALVLNHRRIIRRDEFNRLPHQIQKTAFRLCIILRLAVLFHRGRTDEEIALTEINAIGRRVVLTFFKGWLKQHSLTRADLDSEKKHLKKFGVQLEYKV